MYIYIVLQITSKKGTEKLTKRRKLNSHYILQKRTISQIPLKDLSSSGQYPPFSC